MTSEPASVIQFRAAPTLWITVTCNLFSLLVAVVVLGIADGGAWALWLPVASLSLSAAVGVASLVRPQTRAFGVGCLGGTAASAFAYLVLFVIFFVTYFMVPGGHELS